MLEEERRCSSFFYNLQVFLVDLGGQHLWSHVIWLLDSCSGGSQRQRLKDNTRTMKHSQGNFTPLTNASMLWWGCRFSFCFKKARAGKGSLMHYCIPLDVLDMYSALVQCARRGGDNVQPRYRFCCCRTTYFSEDFAVFLGACQAIKDTVCLENSNIRIRASSGILSVSYGRP